MEPGRRSSSSTTQQRRPPESVRLSSSSAASRSTESAHRATSTIDTPGRQQSHEDEPDYADPESHERLALENSSEENPEQAADSPSEKTKTVWNPRKKAFNTSRRVYGRIVGDFWIPEAIGLFMCIGSLISIVGILFAYQNSPTPHVMKGVSLNTAISILATLSRASVVFVVASVIAQQKWLRFETKASPLSDALLYDDATRGPLGSLFLVGSFRLSYSTTMAAGVVILALGFEPFVQQSVRYPLRNLAVSSQSPRLPTIRDLTLANKASSNRSMLVNEVVLQALYADSIGLSEPSCPGTSCEWPPYESIAFYSSCEDAIDDVDIHPQYDAALEAYTSTSYLNTFQMSQLELGGISPTLAKTLNTTYTISVGAGTQTHFTLNTSGTFDIEYSTTTGYLSYPETIVWDLNGDSYSDCYSHDYPPHSSAACIKWTNNTINGVKGPLKAFGYAKLQPSADGRRLVATTVQRCVITLCARQYQSHFYNGSISSNTTATDFGAYRSGIDLPSLSGSGGHDVQQDLEWLASMNGTSFHGGTKGYDGYYSQGYSILLDFYGALTNLQGHVTRSECIGYDAYGEFYCEIDTMDDSSTDINAAPDVMQFMSDISNNTAKIAQALTNFIQQNGDGDVTGQAYISTPFVEVRWAWLVYPLVLVLIGTVALMMTMWQTRRKKLALWRNSPFPLLFNYHDTGACAADIDAQAEGFTPEAVNTSRHEEMAEETRLRLKVKGGVWVFQKEE